MISGDGFVDQGSDFGEGVRGDDVHGLKTGGKGPFMRGEGGKVED